MIATCAKCGAEISNSHCSLCGRGIGVLITPDVAEITFSAVPPTVVLSGPDPQTGDAMIKVDDPRGVRSEARHTKTGTLSLVVQGAAGVGRKNEARVAKTLRYCFEQRGLQGTITDGADDRGEDRVLQIGNEQFVLQITTAPSARRFWQQAHISSATTQATELHAANWLRTAITNKMLKFKISEPASTILAVDAHHAGILARQPVIDRYLSTFGCPHTEFGLASVWIVGPTAEYCMQLGGGHP